MKPVLWPVQVIPARYYLYSFQDIPAGPSIFQSIFQHILEYMDTDSPLEGLRSSKISRNCAKSRKIAQNRSENGPLHACSKEDLKLCDLTRLEVVWKLERQGTPFRATSAAGVTSGNTDIPGWKASNRVYIPEHIPEWRNLGGLSIFQKKF